MVPLKQLQDAEKIQPRMPYRMTQAFLLANLWSRRPLQQPIPQLVSSDNTMNSVSRLCDICILLFSSNFALPLSSTCAVCPSGSSLQSANSAVLLANVRSSSGRTKTPFSFEFFDLSASFMVELVLLASFTVILHCFGKILHNLVQQTMSLIVTYRKRTIFKLSMKFQITPLLRITTYNCQLVFSQS